MIVIIWYIGGGRQSWESADFFPVFKFPPEEHLHHKVPGTHIPNPISLSWFFEYVYINRS